ncbi:hypothetical protein WR25_04400 [Diploscapter pachys]|uniref:Peptidase M24 domain-containing protein n=1 Tax=Diploscapter pachys TaxID=2018661 RepID=A0A2A2KCT2_9BILA|nr:hypothetical protein WR25_04400 [Diploscapter pachys]
MGRSDSESSASSDNEKSHDEQDETLKNDVVTTKYNVAAEICNNALKEVLAAVKDGAEVAVLCDLGDKFITEKVKTIFKKEGLAKGIAMPTCISVDNCICHFSPLRSDTPVYLKDGQLVKVDLGCHIDGYIATAAHTVVVGATKDNKVKGDAAKLLRATYEAMEIAIRMLRPETKNMDITAAIDKTASEYGVTPIENMLSHQLARNQIDGEKQIIQNPGEKQRGEMEKVAIDKYEAYAIDILFSNGKGKAKDQNTRTTIFKKNDEVVYSLKMKASRIFFSECQKEHGSMPFTLRSFEDEVKAKMGVLECEKHGLLKPYQVLYENAGDLVAQFKSTVLVMPNGLLKITGIPLDYSLLDTDAKLKDPALIATLSTNLKPKNKKKKKAKTDGNAAAAPPAADAKAAPPPAAKAEEKKESKDKGKAKGKA